MLITEEWLTKQTQVQYMHINSQVVKILHKTLFLIFVMNPMLHENGQQVLQLLKKNLANFSCT